MSTSLREPHRTPDRTYGLTPLIQCHAESGAFPADAALELVNDLGLVAVLEVAAADALNLG